MKIVRTEIYRYNIKMEPFVIATGTMYHASNVLIKMFTDEGITGIGECSPFPFIVGETQDTCMVMAKYFGEQLKGKDPLDIQARWNEIEALTARNATAKSAFDMALYDIGAKHAKQPLYKFLNGEKREVETDITIGIGTPDEMKNAALKYVSQGATMLKIKLGKKAKEDVERIRAIRTAIGTNIKLRVDANQGWSFEDALFALNELAQYDIQFCEQPMRTWLDDFLPELNAQSKVPIMADESCYHAQDARRLIKTNSCKYINIKFAKSGGFTESKKIHDIANAANMPCMIGSMLESRLALTANLHFAYASPNVQFFDLDTSIMGQLQDPVIGGVQYKGFHLHIDDAIGIGADVDEVFLNNCEKIIV